MLASTHGPSPVLVVDDSPGDRELIRVLVGNGYDLVEAETASEALELVGRQSFDCVLLDHGLPDEDGVNLVRGLVEDGLSVVMLTGCGDERVAVRALKEGACDYLTKDDLRPELLRRTIQSARERAVMQRELTRQARQLQESMVALRAANDGLHESEARVRMVLEQLPAIVWTTDEKFAYRYVAGSGLAVVTASPEGLVGQPLADGGVAIHSSEVARAAHRRALLGESVDYEMTVGSNVFSCHVYPWEGPMDGAPGVIGIAVDVTNERQLDQRLRRSQKLEAIGQLAGGIAHDFTNILTAITSFATLTMDELGERHPAYPDLREIVDASERGTELTRRMLTFARETTLHQTDLDLAEVVGALEPMLRSLLAEDLELGFSLSDEPCPINADKSAIEQLVLNLVVNARDAVEPGGRIAVAVQRTALAAKRAHSLDVAPGDYVVLTVEDDGVGMSEEVLGHLFEPFFTTKQDAGGTGLGLATCYGVARELGGAIEVVSERGQGAQFSVFIPSGNGNDAPRAVRVEGQGPIPRGRETILIAEDERPLRTAFERYLSELGYRVLVASDGTEALELAKAHGSSIDLLLTDIIMPGLDGVELAERLRPLFPDLAVLFMSGYTRGVLSARSELTPETLYLPKPFALPMLARTVRVVLDGRPVT